MASLNIKKGDTVKVLSGKEKGKSGKVLEVFPKNARLSIEGLNVHVRFSKAKRKGEKGQRLELPSPMNVSNVILLCPNCGKPTRVAHEVTENGNLRKCKKCGKVM
ncbi:MAG: 50S ribosomal protein L24 [Candidatus Doudnabacteria bacterium RIFCSPLOWO2_02_FULL_42_9]|uniref:Large ribosomal subunit protein uL24 n=1 Tax=Candidatus Doudnabacteria bacterium RIFCSPHIGHO2_01_FULL_41_86 TaxID=1817821 RepID=A0A1F5N9C4_9BACT|nr:ribosomal protein L24 [uncultured bacterium]OGE74235.1 MAG: 50S ribosomal protein L24 [Candidatus Doudnabacteria bacterium RIFCSPHIGHO2_01_FULL_41_86]OGE75019.1 MAG: 50S ribosomal protein L24 [Candidatus Doudnabacteria bacterium RIFCSPHIGHO2_01_43_10]OGE85274.1 MAG: 50S ribosomal protein L24 [Candidatus Doudnabacteria bacterium RIFCSPHIGHO2_12_FULL_42_22]OGE86812.1 MAG: 50S ribosomal protein L24 [Candidatus Doudnabacteria bacterium RIFCSPHIGHO2_02_FULL_42_25]OGE92411.1 MAG: 50S ribosomal pr